MSSETSLYKSDWGGIPSGEGVADCGDVAYLLAGLRCRRALGFALFNKPRVLVRESGLSGMLAVRCRQVPVGSFADGRTSMEYKLKIKAVGVYPIVGIDEAKFLSLCQSRRVLSNALLGEEAYDLLVSNHEEFERELAGIAVGRMMRNEYSYEAFFTIKAVLARRLANLVTAGRIYVDQVPRYHALMMGQRCEYRFARTFMNKEYDQSFAYRFMEAYRNHVQHYSATVDSMSLGGDRDKTTRHLAYVVEPYAEKTKLCLNKKFKKEILDEMPEKVDLRRMARGYLAALSKVHHELRRRSTPVISEAKSTVDEAIAEYERQLGKKSGGLHAIQEESGKELASFPLLTDWHKAFELLVERNHSYEDLERHYITTQLKPDPRS